MQRRMSGPRRNGFGAVAMRWFLRLWLVPVGLISLWYVLSFHDFGFFVFSRLLHDEVFRIYGEMLGMEPQAIPPLVAKAILVDSMIVGGVVALAKRKSVIAWWRERRAAKSRLASA